MSTMMPPELMRRFTVDEYHQMIRAGILTEDDPVELLDGWIVPKMPRNPEHDALIYVIQSEVIGPRLPRGWICRSQSAVTLEWSEPEPDLSVVRGAGRDFMTHHPRPSEISILIEVAESSLTRDRTLKARIYAAASVPVYWIINLIDARIEVHTDPSGPCETPTYRTHQEYERADMVPLVLDGQEIAAIPGNELLP